VKGLGLSGAVRFALARMFGASALMAAPSPQQLNVALDLHALARYRQQFKRQRCGTPMATPRSRATKYALRAAAAARRDCRAERKAWRVGADESRWGRQIAAQRAQLPTRAAIREMNAQRKRAAAGGAR
jgi:hypothetical protein